MSEYADNFSQADENPLSSGGVWSGGYTALGDLQVISNRARVATLNADEAMTYNVSSPTNDQFVQFTIATWNTGSSAILSVKGFLRWNAPGSPTGYEIAVNRIAGADSIHVYEMTAGTETELGVGQAITVAAGDVFTGIIRGSQIFVFQNTTLRYTTSDATITSGRIGLGGFVGTGGADSDFEISNFTGGDIRKTRLYLPNTGAPEISPAFTLQASWTATTGADRIKMLTIKKASTMTTKVQAAPGTTANQKWLFRQYVSDPLIGSGTIFGVLFGQVRALESAVNDNIDAVSLKLLVVTPAAGLRGTLLALANYGTIAECNTALRNKIIANGDGLTAIAYQDGDRIVAEIGLTNTTTGTSVSGSMSFGDDNATDLTEDETDATAHNPWLEIVGMVAPIGSMQGPNAQMVNAGMVGNVNV